MKYLIDTDVIVDYLRAKILLKKEFLEADSGISIITLGELIYGAYKSTSPKRSIDIILGFIKESNLKIVELSQESIFNFGKLKSELEILGQRLEDFDLLIAATALVSNLTLVTRNINHFKRIRGLRLATTQLS